MASLESTKCCGIRELNGVQGDAAETVLHQAPYHWFEDDMDAAFIFFSVVENHLEKGQDLAALIKKLKLGKINKIQAARNPNSGNLLHMYVWTADQTAVRNYYRKNKTIIEQAGELNY